MLVIVQEIYTCNPNWECAIASLNEIYPYPTLKEYIKHNCHYIGPFIEKVLVGKKRKLRWYLQENNTIKELSKEEVLFKML